MTKTLLLVVGVLLLAGLLYIGAPFIGCWYNHHRFGRYVHIQIDLPSCGDAASEQVSRSCRYIFSFEGAEGPEAFNSLGRTSNTVMIEPNELTWSVEWGMSLTEIMQLNLRPRTCSSTTSRFREAPNLSLFL
jgi:hypothetical protein